MSSFSFFFDLPLSCLILAKDEANHGFWTNPLEMICARQVILATYGLHHDEAALFAKNVGWLTPSTYLFEELVLVHVASQLNHLLNQLLEMYMGLATTVGTTTETVMMEAPLALRVPAPAPIVSSPCWIG